MSYTCSNMRLSSGATMRAAWNTEGRSLARKGYLRPCNRQCWEVISQWYPLGQQCWPSTQQLPCNQICVSTGCVRTSHLLVDSSGMNDAFYRTLQDSQENTGSRTRYHLESCNRWCHQDTGRSCHTGQSSSPLQPGRGWPRTLGGKTPGERGRLISPPLPSPWGCETRAGCFSHTSGWPGCKCTLRGSSGACQSSTQPERGQKAGSRKVFQSRISKAPTHATYIWIRTAVVSRRRLTAGLFAWTFFPTGTFDTGHNPQQSHSGHQGQSYPQHLQGQQRKDGEKPPLSLSKSYDLSLTL